MSEFTIDESEKLPLLQAVFNNLKQSVQLENDLLKQIQKMENVGLSSTTEYKLIKLRQFEESFFALFLLRLSKELASKRENQTYADCVRAFKRKMGGWRKDDRNSIRKEHAKTEYIKKVMYKSLENSIEKSKKYINFLEEELKNAEK